MSQRVNRFAVGPVVGEAVDTHVRVCAAKREAGSRKKMAVGADSLAS